MINDEYNYDSESTLGDNKLSTYTFKGMGWSGDIGFSTSLDLFEQPYGCY